MSDYVADTHALYWYLTNSPLLGANASQAFQEADAGNALIYIPAIVLAELFYLNAKKGNPLNFTAEFQRLNQSSQFVLLPFFPEDILEFDSSTSVPEMHDRMIAGVAKRLNLPCLTIDKEIVGSGVVITIW